MSENHSRSLQKSQLFCPYALLDWSPLVTRKTEDVSAGKQPLEGMPTSLARHINNTEHPLDHSPDSQA
jgi:hypothetical protein